MSLTVIRGIILCVALYCSLSCAAESRGGLPVETAPATTDFDRAEPEGVAPNEPAEEASQPPPSPPPTVIEAPPRMVIVPACEWREQLVRSTDVITVLTQVPSFAIDVLEVRVDEYAACVRAGACPVPRVSDHHCNWPRRTRRADHPINCVDQQAAQSYCTYANKRLPTRDEWRAAATCEEPQRYPWGTAPMPSHSTIDANDRQASDQLCWDGDRGDMLGDYEDWRPPRRFTGGTCVVGSFPAGANLRGVLDLAGNVWEWTSSLNPYNGTSAILCGGGWRTLYHTNDALLPHYQVGDCPSIPPNTVSSDIGIRCVWDSAR